MAKTGGPKYAEADATVPIIGPWASIESGYSPRRCRRPGTARKCRLLPAAADETGTARVPRRKRRRLSGARRTTAFAPGGKGWARRRGAPADDPRPPPRRIPIPGEKRAAYPKGCRFGEEKASQPGIGGYPTPTALVASALAPPAPSPGQPRRPQDDQRGARQRPLRRGRVP